MDPTLGDYADNSGPQLMEDSDSQVRALAGRLRRAVP
jgi:hypothetical protein